MADKAPTTAEQANRIADEYASDMRHGGPPLVSMSPLYRAAECRVDIQTPNGVVFEGPYTAPETAVVGAASGAKADSQMPEGERNTYTVNCRYQGSKGPS